MMELDIGTDQINHDVGHNRLANVLPKYWLLLNRIGNTAQARCDGAMTGLKVKYRVTLGHRPATLD